MRYKYSSSRCLSEGSNFKLEVPDEPKGKSVDTHEGTGLKLGVLDVSTVDSFESETSDNEEETQDDEYAHTREDYVPTDDETNDETNDVDEEEYDRINKVYGDVNVRLTDVEPDAEDKGDKEMTNAETVKAKHENVNQEGVGNQVKDDAQATQKTEVPIPSSSISSDYAAKFLNFDNIPSVDTEVVSMLDINVQHEAPRTSPILTIPDVKELNDVDNSTISYFKLFPIDSPISVKEYLGSSMDDAMYKVIQRNFDDIVKEHSVPAKIPKSTGKSAQADEIVFEAVDTQGPQNLGEDTGNTDEPPVVNIDPKDWFKKLKRPPTLDLEWNKGRDGGQPVESEELRDVAISAECGWRDTAQLIALVERVVRGYGGARDGERRCGRKKRTLVTVEEEEHEPANKVKKAPAKAKRSKGIELLSDAALLEEAQLKKALKRSKRDTNIHQAGDSGDEANEQEETQDDEYVHTPKDYVPTDDETNDVDEEEYNRIDKVYGDVNVRLTDAEPDTENKGDKEMTNAEIVEAKNENVNQEGVGNQVKDDAQAAQKKEVPIPSSSISSDYAAKFLNFDNIPSIDTEVVSMLDINVQHEAPLTSPLLTILVSVIPEHTVINPSEIVITASSTIISFLLTSLFPNLQQSTLIPTPTTTEATTSTTAVPDSETLTALHQRIVDLEKDVKELKDVDNSTKVISTIQFEVPKAVKEYLGSSLDDAMQQYAPQKSIEDILEIKMEHARKQQVPKETITPFDTTALREFDQNTTLFETMTKSKSFNKSLKQRALYHALMKSILEDEDAMDEGIAKKLKKRKPDDADKDKGPFTESD
ncbi:hypothetical protein Tco_0421555 [Tanacetum coccineum]